MTLYNERTSKTILNMAGDADGDPLSVIRVNGSDALVGVPIPLSVGGLVTVSSDGEVIFDDTGFMVPEIGDFVADGLIVTITDGTVEIDTTVNLELYGAASAQTVVFGALTRRFEGGIAAPDGASSIVGGDPDGHFAISGGMILPTLAGSGNLSGNYVLTMDTGDTQQVIALPGVFSISSDVELSSLLNDSSQPFDGHTIQMRPGQYDIHTLPSLTYENGGVTITGDGPGVQIRRLFIDDSFGNPEIVIRGIAFTTDDIETDALNRLHYSPNATPNGVLRVEDCRFSGHAGINADPERWFAKLDYTGATSIPQAGERIDNDGGGDAGAYTKILQVQDNGDGTGTLFVDDNPGQSNGGSADNQGVAWASGQVMTGSGGWSATVATGLYGGDATLGNGIEGGHAFDEIYVERNQFSRLNQALEVSATTDIVVRNNVASLLKGDFIKIHCFSGIAPTNQTLVERNLLSQGMVGSSDYSNPHSDGIQLSGSRLTQDWEHMIVRDNVFWTGFSERSIARTNQVQPLFLTTKNKNGFGLRGAQILNNIADSGGSGNCIVLDYAYDCLLQNNTAVSSLLRNTEQHQGALKIIVGNNGTDGNCEITRNVGETISVATNNAFNNTTAEKNFDFSAYYPAWTGIQDFTDVTTLFDRLTPAAGSPVMSGASWDPLNDHGCINEAGRFIAHDGTDLTEHFLDLERLRDGETTLFTAQAPEAFLSSDWSLSDPGTGDALDLIITNLPDSGGSAILELQISVDGGSFVTLRGVTTGTYQIDGLVADTPVSVVLRALNGAGAGPDSDAQTLTPTVSTSAPGQFASSDWSIGDATLGGTVTVTLTSMPSDGGSAITAVEYSIDGGVFVDLGRTTPGEATVTGLSDDVEVDVVLRAVNAIGAGPSSDLKSVTPTLGEETLDESFAALEPDFARMVYDSDRLHGGVTSDVPVAVNQPGMPNTALQARALDASGNATAWSDIGTTDGSGLLTGMLSNIPRSANWYKWQIRKTASPEEGGTTLGEFGVGDVLGFFGQSPLDQSFITSSSPRALNTAEMLTLVTGEGAVVEHVPITNAERYNDTMTYLNDMVAATSDAVCMIVDLCRSGTGRVEWADNSDTDRNWQNDALRIQHVRDAGSEIGLIYETWHTFDVGPLSNDAVGNFLPFYTGLDASGATVSYGTTINGTYQLDQSLFDLSGQGRGLLDHARTQMVMATPYGNAHAPLRNYFTGVDGVFNNSARIRFKLRDQMALLNADTRMQQVVQQVGPYSINVRVEDGGTIHLDGLDEHGRPHILRNGLAAMYLANGVIADDYGPDGLNTTEATPEITNVTWATTHADVQVSVPSGRSLTTIALARGMGPLGTSQPHFAEVMGFEVAQTEMHDLLPTGFTAVVHDATNGIIRISPENGAFAPGARIAFARGPSVPAFLDSDKAAGTHLYMPIVTCGSGGGYEGLPLRPNVTFVATEIASVGRTPRVVTQPDAGFSITQNTTLGAGLGGALTLEFIGTLLYMNESTKLITLNGSKLELSVNRDGGVKFMTRGHNETVVFNETSVDGLVHHGWTVNTGRVLHLVATIDMSTNQAHVWLKNDAGQFEEILTPSFTTTETEFPNNRRFTFGSSVNNQCHGEFQKFAAYFATTADGDTSGLTPYLIKTPDAANFNATSNAGVGPDFLAPVNPVVDA